MLKYIEAIEDLGIVETVYSDIFRHIEGIKAYWMIFSYYWGIWSHNHTYSKLCVTLAYTNVSEPLLTQVLIKASSKACQTCTMIMYFQSPVIVRILSRIFRHIQACWSKSMFTHRQAIKTETGDLSSSFLKIKKRCLDLGKKALIVSIFGLNLPFKMKFKNI